MLWAARTRERIVYSIELNNLQERVLQLLNGMDQELFK